MLLLTGCLRPDYAPKQAWRAGFLFFLVIMLLKNAPSHEGCFFVEKPAPALRVCFICDITFLCLSRSNLLLREQIQPFKLSSGMLDWQDRPFSPLCIWLYRDFVNNNNNINNIMVYSTPAICLLMKWFYLFRARFPKHDSAIHVQPRCRQKTRRTSFLIYHLHRWFYRRWSADVFRRLLDVPL